MGVIAHQYERNVRMFSDVSAAVLLLKRAHYGLPGSGTIPESDLRGAADKMAWFLQEVQQGLVSETPGRTNVLETFDIPPILVESICRAKESSPHEFREDLNVTINGLRSTPVTLTSTDIELLDEMCKVSDTTTTALYRRFRRG